jgi:hypothetical protein
MPGKYASPLARVEANSTPCPMTGCWLWTGRAFPNMRGMLYGYMTVRRKSGKRKGKTRNVLAHRFSCSAATGIPLWRLRVVSHRCDVSLCVNPAHLSKSTQSKNTKESYARGRRAA